MPISLFAGAEDGEGVDMVASSEDQSAGESGAEGGELFGCEDGIRSSEGGKQCEGASWGGGFGGGRRERGFEGEVAE